jgi:hypothetical protein
LDWPKAPEAQPSSVRRVENFTLVTPSGPTVASI